MIISAKLEERRVVTRSNRRKRSQCCWRSSIDDDGDGRKKKEHTYTLPIFVRCRTHHCRSYCQNHTHAGIVICREGLGTRGRESPCSPYGLILRVIPRREWSRTRPDNRPEEQVPVLKQMEAACECGSGHRFTSSRNTRQTDQGIFVGVFE
jgi:hypothetical protein